MKAKWKWNPRDPYREPPCIRCHTSYCSTRFRHPQKFTNTFPVTDMPCPKGCTTDHGHVVPVYVRPPPTHREFVRLLELKPEEHTEPWLIRGQTMPICIPPGYAVPGSPKYVGPLSKFLRYASIFSLIYLT